MRRKFIPFVTNRRQKKRFVGHHEHPLKYDAIWRRLPHESFGIQGTDHLLPGKGRIAERLPIKIRLKKDHKYMWCACGYSNHQPLCDGSHNREATKLRPVTYIAEKDLEVWFCACKQTKNRPFCDGSHKLLPPPEDEQFLVSGLVKKKKK